ncbi:translation initiation factor eIF 4e-like domain-containing protein [Rhizoctonia solani]|nr:translation initiation factor eIF 4e-like domain-containing protein [Rhizoctonia solani]
MADAQQNSTPPLEDKEKEKRRAAGRLPGLEDLAARMNVAAPTSTSTRPRLATSLLRTNSSTGTGPPSASSDKPNEIPPPVSISVSDPNGEEVKPAQPMPRGYKNVPSLDAIAGRLKAQKEKEKAAEEGGAAAESEPGTGAKVELEQGEIDESKPEVDTSVLHPLRHKWTFYFDAKPPPPRATGEATPVPYTPSNTETGEYEAGLKIVGKFRTVEDFCRLFNWVKPPSKLERSSNYHMFKEDIKPMWEDPANANGGKWVITMRNNPALLDRCWSWLAMGLVGQELDDREDMICGAVVSLRSRIDRIQLWVRQKDDVERVNAIGKKLVKLLDLDREPGIQLEFQFNSDERPPTAKYISIMPPQPSFRRGPETPGSEHFGRGGGAFGAFGRGGAFGGAGRGRGDWGPKSAVEGSAPFGGAGAGHARSSSTSGAGDK